MNAFEKRRMRGQGGFTLIELLVVIAILAVLAGVVVFAVNGMNNNSQTTACKTEARTVKTAVQAYYASNSQNYPGTQAALKGTFLEDEPTGVTYTLVSGTPTYAWAGSCTTAPNLPSTP